MEPEEQNNLSEPQTTNLLVARARLPSPPDFLSDAVLGGVYGCVTTTAVVAGALGAGFSNKVALVLGLAVAMACGLHMAIGSFRNTSARWQRERSVANGNAPSGRAPVVTAGITFLGFIGIGSLPLIPFPIARIDVDSQFIISLALAGTLLYGVGLAKGWILGRSLLASAIDTLVIGSVSAAIAYVSGWGVQQLIGA